MEFASVTNTYLNCLELIVNKVQSRLSDESLRMFVSNKHELPNAFLYCAAEFNNPARVSKDDYGLALMVVYQKDDPRIGAVANEGDIYVMAGLCRSSGETISKFEPVKINAADKSFDIEFRLLTTRIKLFLQEQEDMIVATLTREYLTP